MTLPEEKDQVVDKHYLRAVTELGDERRIVSTCDIYSQTGIKLLAAGIQVTSSLYEKLVRHKLLPVLDKALTTDDMLSIARVLSDLEILMESNSRMTALGDEMRKGDSYRQILGDFKIPSALAFKLTVAKEKFPRIYEHSLLLMAVSTYLARCDGLNAAEVKWAGIAALFHDIGLLHIDPALLEPHHEMTPAERKHLYAHPLTAYILLNEFPELPRAVGNAVLEHHERMDGSGYPRGLRGDKISRNGQILAIAELAAKAFDSEKAEIPWKKLDVMLKLNSRKYGQGLIGFLSIFRDSSEGVQEGMSFERLTKQVQLISILFNDFYQNDGVTCNPQAQEFAQARLEELRLGLFEAGFDPRDPESLIQMFEEDPECMKDYALLLDEVTWQFKSLMLEIARQWSAQTGGENAGGQVMCAWLSMMNQTLAEYSAETMKG
ncbi:MAG: HD domain-containing protein [Gammaproteobacteria bacterium]|nr:HD domain-containing protein [Gammaproteobacteria bacterium]MBU1623563.1 HD domain-containing protein [Gammaproteobacteria bacterium]